MISTEKGMARYLDQLAECRARGMVPGDIRRAGQKAIVKAPITQETLRLKLAAEQKARLAQNVQGGCRLDHLTSVGNGL